MSCHVVAAAAEKQVWVCMLFADVTKIVGLKAQLLLARIVFHLIFNLDLLALRELRHFRIEPFSIG